ncbi:MAG: hypothetical protein RR792_02880 [Thermomonas sp.]
MNRESLLALSLALSLVPAVASAAAKTPPAEYAAYVAAMRKADAIADPLQRCLAYPDLPGNSWPAGAAKARCTMFLTPARYSLDAIDAKLKQPGGAAELEAAFAALLDAHFKEPAQREQISIALMVFRDNDYNKAERIARAWRAAAPDSAFARVALGHVLTRRGWNARGTDYAAKTPAENLKKMSGYFVDAAKEYMTALEGTSRLLPACEGLMAIGRQSSDDLQTYATERCLYIDPTSYYVVDELMTAAEPRWGGSEEAMKSVAAYAQEKAKINPVLSVFASHAAYYEISRMDDGDDQSIAILAPAALQVPNAAYLRYAGGAYLRKDDDWKALAYLSQALRFMPGYGQESRFRALVLRQLGESKWARADAERAATLDPANGHAHQQLGNIVRELDGAAAAAPHFKRAMEDARTREYAFNDYCGSLIDAKRLDEAGKCVDDLLAAYPANPEGWRQRLIVIGFDAPGSIEAMERFLALNDPKRWDYHARSAEGVRKMLAVRKGTGSPADVFESRVIRAEVQERTAAGRGYFEQLKAKAPRFMNDALTACQPAQKPGIPLKFTLVMDVQADGRVANVAVTPVNAWTSCIAKQGGATFKLPPPPQVEGKASYPMVIHFEIK